MTKLESLAEVIADLYAQLKQKDQEIQALEAGLHATQPTDEG